MRLMVQLIARALTVSMLCISASLAFCQKSNVSLKRLQIKSPYGAVDILSPDFSKCGRFNITDYGAVRGEKKATSEAIRKAIEGASASGGGKVIVPAGEWLTGKIHLKDNVNLHLEEGAVLLFSEDPEDYLPAVHSTWEGMECLNYSPLVYAYKCKNVAISGSGELKAKMDIWKQWFPRPAPHMQSIKRLYNLAFNYAPLEERMMVNDSAHLRPQFIQFNRCENVLLEGVKITNSPFWTIHPYLSKNVVIRKLNVYAHGHNNDGVDPEMSQNVLIEDCIFDQGDDAIAIKSGRNPEGWRLKTPSKNIIIRNCLVKNGHQLVAIGTELSGGIENVYVENCEVADGAKLYHLLFIKTNERMGGYVKNVMFKNVRSGNIDMGILGIETDVLYQWKDLVPTQIVRLTPISHVILDKVSAKNVKFIARIQGNKAQPIGKVTLRGVKAENISGKDYFRQNIRSLIIEP